MRPTCDHVESVGPRRCAPRWGACSARACASSCARTAPSPCNRRTPGRSSGSAPCVAGCGGSRAASRCRRGGRRAGRRVSVLGHRVRKDIGILARKRLRDTRDGGGEGYPPGLAVLRLPERQGAVSDVRKALRRVRSAPAAVANSTTLAGSGIEDPTGVPFTRNPTSVFCTETTGIQGPP